MKTWTKDRQSCCARTSLQVNVAPLCCWHPWVWSFIQLWVHQTELSLAPGFHVLLGQLCFEWLADALLASKCPMPTIYHSGGPVKIPWDRGTVEVPGGSHWCQWVLILSPTSCSTLGISLWVIFKGGLEPHIQIWCPNLHFKGSPLLKTDLSLWLMCGL